MTGAFQATDLPTPAVTLSPGQETDFVVQITPGCGTGAVSGTLTINGASYS